MGDLNEGSGKAVQNLRSVEDSDCYFASSSANGVRYLVLAKYAGGTNPSCGGSAALKRLEDSSLSVSDLLKEKSDSLMFDSGKCQLTTQIKRESLDEIQDKLASSKSTTEFDSANRRLRRIENTTHQGRTREESSDIDFIQRQTLALVPTGTESAFPSSASRTC